MAGSARGRMDKDGIMLVSDIAGKKVVFFKKIKP
jgi:hypothetical protein